MRAAVVSSYNKQRIIGILKKYGFSVSPRPDIVFTYGGDGTILSAEREFPGIPKVPLQKSMICSKCRRYNISNFRRVLDAISAGKFRIREETKVEALFGKERITALNEIQIRNEDMRKSLRLSLSWKDRRKEVIGDGLVAATPYGSTAYYRSLGYKPFSSGIRIGFNNVWPRIPAIKVDKCAVKIIREDALLAADNFLVRKMRKGDGVVIRKSKQKARFVVI